jgi:competence protein ComEA
LIVDVAGAIPKPGVYEFPEGSRVKDAVEAAGGFLAEADKSTINLAAPLEDGQRLDIPFLAGTEPLGAVPTQEVQAELIDINTADVDTLSTLPGIGPTLAQRIVDYRDTYGPFFFIEDLMNVEGISAATFENIKDLITTGFE